MSNKITQMQYRKYIDEPNMSDKTLLVSVEDLISGAFGPTAGQNIINFKIVQMVLVILARQMRLLEQEVEIKIDEVAMETKEKEGTRDEYQQYSDYSIESTEIATIREDDEEGATQREERDEGEEDGGRRGGKETRGDKKSKDKGKADRGGSKDRDKADRGGSKEKGKSGDRGERGERGGQGGERGGDRGGDRDERRDGERGGDRGGERDEGRDGQRSGDQGGKRDEGRGGEQRGDRGGDRGGERGADRDSDRGGGRGADRSDDTGGGRGGGQGGKGGKGGERGGERGTKARSGAGPQGRSPGKEGSRTSIIVTEAERKGRKGAKDKILVVEKGPTTRADSRTRVGSIEVVTASQFALLENAVRQLMTVAGPLPMPALPDNAKLREDLAKGTASLPDTMQAMQLNARVQAAEQALTRMAGLLTQLAAAGALPEDMTNRLGEFEAELQQAAAAAATTTASVAAAGHGPAGAGPGGTAGGWGPGEAAGGWGPEGAPGGSGPGRAPGGGGPGGAPGKKGRRGAPGGVGPGGPPGGAAPGGPPGGAGPGGVAGGWGPGQAAGGGGPGGAAGGGGPGGAAGGGGPGGAAGGWGPGGALGGGGAAGGWGPGGAPGGGGPGGSAGGWGPPGGAPGGGGPGGTAGGWGPGGAPGAGGPGGTAGGWGPGGAPGAGGPGGTAGGWGPGGAPGGGGPGGTAGGWGPGGAPGGGGPGGTADGWGPGGAPGGGGPGGTAGGWGPGGAPGGGGPGGTAGGWGPGGAAGGWGPSGAPGAGGIGGTAGGWGPGGAAGGWGPGGAAGGWGPGGAPGGGGPGGTAGGWGPDGGGHKSVGIDTQLPTGGGSRPDSARVDQRSGATSMPSSTSGGMSTSMTVGVSHPEMNNVLHMMRDHLMKEIAAMTARATQTSESASNMAKAVSEKLDIALKLDKRIDVLYSQTSDYAEQLSGFDSGVTTQMASFQEQMLQLRSDLTGGLTQLEQANNNAETAALIDLNQRYEGLVVDLDNTLHAHQGLTASQRQLSEELRSLVECVEMLREQKADRDEVFDGLRDKADITRLTGLLNDEDFATARIELEKRLEMCYEKFNKQDRVWLNVIADLSGISEGKAEILELLAIKDNATDELKAIQEILRKLYIMLGEPKAAVLMRQLAKNAVCAGCLVPALMEPQDRSYGKPHPLASLRPPPLGEETCLTDLKMPTPHDAREHVCHRWVGGSHTLMMENVTRGKADVQLARGPPTKRYTGYGTDGRLYMLEEELLPCIECNIISAEPPTGAGDAGGGGGGDQPAEPRSGGDKGTGDEGNEISQPDNAALVKISEIGKK